MNTHSLVVLVHWGSWGGHDVITEATREEWLINVLVHLLPVQLQKKLATITKYGGGGGGVRVGATGGRGVKIENRPWNFLKALLVNRILREVNRIYLFIPFLRAKSQYNRSKNQNWSEMVGVENSGYSPGSSSLPPKLFNPLKFSTPKQFPRNPTQLQFTSYLDLHTSAARQWLTDPPLLTDIPGAQLILLWSRVESLSTSTHIHVFISPVPNLVAPTWNVRRKEQ